GQRYWLKYTKPVLIEEHLKSTVNNLSPGGKLLSHTISDVEDLNKNWIAEWMYQFAGTGKTYYESIGIDTVLMSVNDVIAQGAMPVVYTDEV
ncbi:unnamed protein product, partial [marine sediment metagenome]